VRRRLHQIEREYAIAATSERLLDLSACARLARIALPEPLTRGTPATIEERMIANRDALDGVLGVLGARTLDEVETSIEEGGGSQEVDFSLYRFRREDLARIPARPGIYRFRGEDGNLLYVGKSRDLNRRVASYFRPLAPDHRRRASLLGVIRDLQWETTPSELEALLLESEAIRTDRPTFNQQIDVHPQPVEGTRADSDLAFVLCDGDPNQVSTFLYCDRLPWARGRLPRGPVDETREAALAMAEAWRAGVISTEAGLTRLDETGRVLVSRFLTHHRDRLDRLDNGDFAGLDDVAEALVDLASRERPAWEPWSLRGAADPL
jgi:hypothetical protein